MHTPSDLMIEIERKFRCNNRAQLEKELEYHGFTYIGKNTEKDTYFIDTNGSFITNKTCLRIRETSLYTELTYKGPSPEQDTQQGYSKVEYNISLLPQETERTIHVFEALGFPRHSIVHKQRDMYEKNHDTFLFSIVLDTIEGAGDFIEFEILSPAHHEQATLKSHLDSIIGLFTTIGEEIHLPYRDLVTPLR